MKKLFPVSLFIFLSMSAEAQMFSRVGELPSTPALKEASKLVVLLDIKSSRTVGSGAGFILSADPNTKTAWIMTAAHCIYCKNSSSCEVSAKGIFGKVKGNLKTLRFDTLNDIALIQVQLPKKWTLPIRAPFAKASEMVPGDRAVWFGDPSLELRESKEWVLPRPNDYVRRGVRFTDGKVQSFSDRFPVSVGNGIQYVPNLLLYGESLPGNSGGPVFNDRGEVVGIIIKSVDNKKYCTTITDICYPVAAPSDTLVEFASKNIF
ncbi:MAG: serine protease [Bdellovibrionales bacterium]|nr:serine protease [Bdellovibrionales bacterium]